MHGLRQTSGQAGGRPNETRPLRQESREGGKKKDGPFTERKPSDRERVSRLSHVAETGGGAMATKLGWGGNKHFVLTRFSVTVQCVTRNAFKGKSKTRVHENDHNVGLQFQPSKKGKKKPTIESFSTDDGQLIGACKVHSSKLVSNVLKVQREPGVQGDRKTKRTGEWFRQLRETPRPARQPRKVGGGWEPLWLQKTGELHWSRLVTKGRA